MRRRSTSCSAAAAASSNGCRSCAARRRCATNARDSATRRRPRPIPGAAKHRPAAATPRAAIADAAPTHRADPWPSFRGANAAGVADGQGVVAEWDVATGAQHQLEDADSRSRHLEPDRLGRPRDRRHRGQRRRQVVPHRPLRRRQAGREPADAQLSASMRSIARPARSSGSAMRSAASRSRSATPSRARPTPRPSPTAATSSRCSDRSA